MVIISTYVFKTRKQYWSAVKNTHRNLINSNNKILRSKYFKLTKDPIFKEKNYEKRLRAGKSISLAQVRKAFKKGRAHDLKILKKQYKEMKKDGFDVGTFKNFIKTNTSPDFNEIREMFNSPK